jgi:hypothetical protein
MRSVRTVVLVLAVLIQVSRCADLKRPTSTTSPHARSTRQRDTSSPFSTRDGPTITLHPSGFTFELPANWVTWYSERGNNLHLSRDQLRRVEKPDSDEWDREFARISNASLPFDRCAAHVGSEGWGQDARLYSDLQVRVYDLLDPTNDLEERIVKAATATARVDGAERSVEGPWRRIVIRYDRRHFDYGATAFVDFRMRPFHDRTIVFVFMYTGSLGGAAAIPSILHSTPRH